jgi:hypothetical protein
MPFQKETDVSMVGRRHDAMGPAPRDTEVEAAAVLDSAILGTMTDVSAWLHVPVSTRTDIRLDQFPGGPTGSISCRLRVDDCYRAAGLEPRRPPVPAGGSR